MRKSISNMSETLFGELILPYLHANVGHRYIISEHWVGDNYDYSIQREEGSYNQLLINIQGSMICFYFDTRPRPTVMECDIVNPDVDIEPILEMAMKYLNTKREYIEPCTFGSVE